MTNQITGLRSVFDGVGCALSMALVITGAVAISFFHTDTAAFFSAQASNRLNSSFATVLIVTCWLLLVVTVVWVLIAAFLYLLTPERFWGKAHAINLGLAAFGVVWIGLVPGNLFPVAVAVFCGAIIGVFLARAKIHRWKGSHVVLILLTLAMALVPAPAESANQYALPILGAISLAAAIYLFLTRTRSNSPGTS